jgi:hypothetical protein
MGEELGCVDYWGLLVSNLRWGETDVPSNVQILEMAESEFAAFFAVAIMDSELSMPWILPVPLASVWAIWRLRTPSRECQFEKCACRSETKRDNVSS